MVTRDTEAHAKAKDIILNNLNNAESNFKVKLEIYKEQIEDSRLSTAINGLQCSSNLKLISNKIRTFIVGLPQKGHSTHELKDKDRDIAKTLRFRVFNNVFVFDS